MAETETNQEEKVLTPEEILVEMEKNTVPKSEYDELEQRFNKLFQQRANGLVLPEEDKPESEEELRAECVNVVKDFKNHENHGTIAHMKSMLAADDYLTSHGHRSLFAPSEQEINSDTQAFVSDLHDLISDAIEVGDGDNDMAATYFAKHLTGFAINNKH